MTTFESRITWNNAMKTTLKSAFPILVLAAFVSACGTPSPAPEQETSAAVEKSSSHGSIQWFEGSVDEAFALAKAEGKPVFMYWGAIWCPPCHYLKSKVFSQPSFQARLASFVPVYLDGDTERAQILGEKYETAGYPTVIVFSSEGEEVMRLDSMIPADLYSEVLENAMNSTQPIDQVVAKIQASSIEEASQADLSLLAFYSWGQDSRVGMAATDRAELFRRLWVETPADWQIEKVRFLALYLNTLNAMAHDPEAELPELDGVERTMLAAAVTELLEDPATRNTNLELAVYWSPETVDLLTPNEGEDRETLKATFEKAAQAMETDTSLAVADRLSAIFPQIYLARLPSEKATTTEEDDEEGENQPLPIELVEHIKERIAWASEEVRDENELQAVMNTMAGLLSEADLLDEAQDLLSEHNQDTVAPYYFTSWLASIKKNAGEKDAAIELYREAWQSASGNYTRFRWGSTYLRNLLELRPDDLGTIEKDGTAALTELLEHEEAFAGGNWSRLQSLSRALEDWNEEGQGDATLDAFRTQVLAACDRYPEEEAEDSAGKRCKSFLDSAA